jgi:hypothetical protein
LSYAQAFFHVASPNCVRLWARRDTLHDVAFQGFLTDDLIAHLPEPFFNSPGAAARAVEIDCDAAAAAAEP